MAVAADRDWAQLPTDLLGTIAKRLAVADYIRFAGVCHSWVSTASPPDVPFLPQMPWLLFSGDKRDPNHPSTIVTLPDRRRRRVSLYPEMRGRWLVGSRDGWVALLDKDCEVSLLNPLTGAQIHLPSATTMPDLSPVHRPDGSMSHYLIPSRSNWRSTFSLAEFRRRTFKKIVWAPRPAIGSYTAAAIHANNKATFATADSGEWTLLIPLPSFADDHGGKFLAVSDEGELWGLDVAGPSPRAARIAKGVRFRFQNKFLQRGLNADEA